MPDERRRRGSRREHGEQRLEARREVATVRCPFCHSDVPQDALAAKCGKCQTVHHATCFDEKGGCSVDGCGGKAAHVVKGWRGALGDCRACRAKVYLDENVAVCASCESLHHPACLEARDGCAECGSGEGMLVLASALAQRGNPAFWVGVLAALPVVLGLVAALALWSTGRGHFAGPAAVVGIALAPFTGLAGARLDAARRRRLLQAAEKVVTDKVVAAKPAPPKAES